MQNSTLAMRFLDDLIAIWLATTALLVAILLAPNNPARVVLGLPFVLFFPGYVLIAALYPRRSDLDGVERVALSLGLSLAVVRSEEHTSELQSRPHLVCRLLLE